jgi:uncharacterized coiled-coil protein SlyX
MVFVRALSTKAVLGTGGGMPPVAVALVMVLSALAISPSLAGSVIVKNEVANLEEGIKKIQFRTTAAMYTQLREVIIHGSFPAELFNHSLSRLSKTAEQQASLIAEHANDLKLSWENGTGLEKPLAEKKYMWVALEILELREDLLKIDVVKLRDLNRQLRDALVESYKPKAPLEVLGQDLEGKLFVVAIIASVLMPLALLPIGKRFVRIFSLSGALLVLVLSLATYQVVTLAGGTMMGPPQAVTQARGLLASISTYEQHLEVGYKLVNDSLNYLSDYCSALDGFNETISATFDEFTEKIKELTSSESVSGVVTKPELVMDIVTKTRSTLANQRSALTKLASSGSTKKTLSLNHLLEMIGLFDVLFSQMEIAIYANLRTGYEMNELMADHLNALIGYIDNGNLQDCMRFLSELTRQQNSQLTRLKEANAHVVATNDAVSKIRLESTRLQPQFASEEFNNWIKKTAAKASMITVGAPLLATLSLPAAAAAPAILLSTAVAVVGYNWAGAFDQMEKDAKEIVVQLGNLDGVLHNVEAGLSSHEVMLTMLASEVGSVISKIDRSEKRFRLVRNGQIFTETEIEQLKAGVNRVIEAVKKLGGRYRSSMDTMYLRLKDSKPSTLELPKA